MMKTAIGILIAWLLASLAPASAAAATVVGAWSRPAVETGVAYATVLNPAATPDALVAVRTPVARAAELHETTSNGAGMGAMVSMMRVRSIAVPAHGRVVLRPGGYHVMLIGLRHSLRPGTTFPLSFEFARGGWTTVEVRVRALQPAREIAAAGVYAVHGTVLGTLKDGRAIVSVDPVPLTLRAGTRAYRLDDPSAARAGTAIDALVEKARPDRLFDVRPAEAFVAGTPDAFATHVYATGDTLPAFPLIDQTGRIVHFSDFLGKTTLLSFVFSRCPDPTICPAISGKFLYLQQHVDPSRFHLVEVTLDPAYDSPAVLKQYGSAFDADPDRWSIVTGEPQEIKTLIDRFGISSISDRPGDYIHDDRLVVVDPAGHIASILETIGWSPDDAIALGRDAAGMSSNPLRRFYAATIAKVVALCGGGSSTGVVLLDSVIFIVGVVVLGGATVWIGRMIFAEKF
jgi:protein SCO1/2